MKTLILFCFAIVYYFTVSAQDQIVFTYDAAGNRVKREVIYLELQSGEEDSFFSEEKIDEEEIKEIDPNQIVGENYTVNIYPNPTMGELAIQIAPYSDYVGTISLYTGSGVLLQEGALTGEYTKFDISTHANGSYQLVVVVDENTYNWTIIKK